MSTVVAMPFSTAYAPCRHGGPADLSGHCLKTSGPMQTGLCLELWVVSIAYSVWSVANRRVGQWAS